MRHATPNKVRLLNGLGPLALRSSDSTHSMQKRSSFGAGPSTIMRYFSSYASICRAVNINYRQCGRLTGLRMALVKDLLNQNRIHRGYCTEFGVRTLQCRPHDPSGQCHGGLSDLRPKISMENISSMHEIGPPPSESTCCSSTQSTRVSTKSGHSVVQVGALAPLFPLSIISCIGRCPFCLVSFNPMPSFAPY